MCTPDRGPHAHTCQTAIAALIATVTLTLALAATTATARNFQLSEREFEVLFRELKFETSAINISCPITLLGHFVERTTPKIVGTQVGVIRHVTPATGAEPNPCTGGTITILNASLPWLIFYRGFTGRLPRITAIRLGLVGVAFRLRTSNGLGCLVGTTPAEPAFGEVLVNETTGRVEGLKADESVGIRLGGPFLCSFAGISFFWAPALS